MGETQYYCDDSRHVVCVPYTVTNLHAMAQALGVKRCWFHASGLYPHYDMPKRRIAEITARCTLITTRDIIAIAKGEYTNQ